jgi:hypothetical protein
LTCAPHRNSSFDLSQACHSYDTPELIVNADHTTMTALENTNMPKLKLVAKGKVRDIYALPDEADSDKLLFVATDRISAFDIIMDNVRNHVGRLMRKIIRLLNAK